MKIKAFTYLIGWSEIDQWYYGVRYAKGCDVSDIWTKYFTSSNSVKTTREVYGEPDVIEIRQTFESVEEARRWEERVIIRMGMCQSERWLNKRVGKSPSFGGMKHTKATKQKIGEISKNKTQSLETRQKISESHMGLKKGIPLSDEHKRRISEGLYARDPAVNKRAAEKRRGQTRSEETKKLMSESAKTERSKLSEKELIERYGHAKGSTPAKCAKTGVSLGRIANDDPRWDSGLIVTPTTGRKMSEEQKQRMSATIRANKEAKRLATL